MSAKGAVPAGMRICASKSRRAALHLPSRLVVPCGVARSTVSTLIIRDHTRSYEIIRDHPRQSGHTFGVARSTVSTLIIVSLLSAASLLRVMYLKKEAASDAISRRHQQSSLAECVVIRCTRRCHSPPSERGVACRQSTLRIVARAAAPAPPEMMRCDEMQLDTMRCDEMR